MWDAASQGILSVGPDGVIAMANAAAERMFGFGKGEMLGLSVDMLLPQPLQAAHRAHRAAFFAHPRIRPMGKGQPLQGRYKDGREFPVEIALSPLDAPGGIHAIVFISDLSERNRVEAVLRQSEARFALFMQHCPGAAFIKDSEGRYLFANPMFEAVTGESSGQWLHATDERYWPTFAAEFRNLERRVLEHGSDEEDEHLLPTRRGPRYFRAIRFAIPDARGAPSLLAGIFLDITEQRRAEQEQESISGKLAAERESERRRLAGELHDGLVQQLGSLAIELGTLIQHLPAGGIRKRVRSLQKRVVEAAETGRHAAHQLHPLELEVLGFSGAIRSYCADFGRREGIPVEFALGRLPAAISREIASCLYKALAEGLHNVSKHACAKRVWVAVGCTRGLLRLTVRDNGVGFSAGTLAASPGLGVASIKERARLLGGAVSLTAGPKRGTRLVVELPLRENVS
jgi:PAS domain S-box-containing protein